MKASGVGRGYQVYHETLPADNLRPEAKQRSEVAHSATAASTWTQIGMYSAAAVTAQGRIVHLLLFIISLHRNLRKRHEGTEYIQNQIFRLFVSIYKTLEWALCTRPTMRH